MIALAAFQEPGAALKAVKALDGFDWRSRSEVAQRPPEVHECFSAKIVHDAEDPLRIPSPSAGGYSGAPEASGSVEQAPNRDGKEPGEAGSPSAPSKPRRSARVKLQQTGRKLRWEKSPGSEAEAEEEPIPAAQRRPTEAVDAVEVGPEMREVDLSDTHLVVTGLPWDWSALQLQMLFTPFGGVQAMQLGDGLALVRLEELAQHAAAAAHFEQPQPDLPGLRCQHVLGPREKELLAQAAEAERLRKQAEEEAARQRKAAAAEAERLRQAALFASRRVVWEAANADFAAAVLAEAQPADAERCKRLQAAAESLRDASLSKQRRRMFVALVEAERKRQANMATELEHEAMRTADAESKAWQQYLLHAEHQYLEMLRQAEAAETLAMSKADRESRRAEQARLDQERRRRRRERESQAAEGRAMKKADDESRRVEAATFLAEEQAREEFEAELMERAEDEVREFIQQEARREADERRRMAADEAERRRAEEERKQKLVLEWRRKKAARRALESDDEDEAQEPEEEEDQEAKQETSGSPALPQKAIVRNPFGPVNVIVPQQAPAQEEKAKKAKEEEAKRAREEERRRLKDDAAKKRKRETEEAAAELQRFEQELQRRSNFLLRRRQQEEEDLRKEEEAQQRAERQEQERKQREFEASCMAREEKLRMPFELEDRRQESERRKQEEAERRKQERAERKRKEQEEKLREERRAEARSFHPQQAARLLQAKEQEIARMQAELLKRRQEEAQKKSQQKQEEAKWELFLTVSSAKQGKENTSKAKPKFESQPKKEKKQCSWNENCFLKRVEEGALQRRAVGLQSMKQTQGALRKAGEEHLFSLAFILPGGVQLFDNSIRDGRSPLAPVHFVFDCGGFTYLPDLVRASGWNDFTRRVRLAFEQTPRKRRHLLGPQIVSQLTDRAWSITGNIDHRRLCRRDGVVYLLQYLKEALGRLPVPDIGVRLESLILRLKRQPYQSMATWAAHLRQQYRHLQVALSRVRTQEHAEPLRSSTSRPTSSGGGSPQRRASNQTVEEPHAEQPAAGSAEDETETVAPVEEEDELEAAADSPSRSWSRRKGRRESASDSDTSAKALEDLSIWEAHEETLPEVLPSEVLGWLLLRRANLGNQARLSVQAAAGNSLKLEDIEKALRGMEDELVGQEAMGRGHSKGDYRRRTYWVEEAGEWSLIMDNAEIEESVENGETIYVGTRLPPQVYPSANFSGEDSPSSDNVWWSNQDYETGAAGWDDTSWWSWEDYDDLLTPEEHKEVDEAFALAESKVRNFVQARQAVKARNLSRGFYPFAPQSKSVGKGRKGKGKPFKGKGPSSVASSSSTPVMASADDQGFLGAAVGQPGYTGCFICGSKDHDFRTCPRRQGKGHKGGRQGSVHFSDASVFTVTAEPADEMVEDVPAFMSQGELSTQEMAGFAVLDTGATETVGSLPAVEQLMRARHQHLGYAEEVRVVDQPPKRFKFGNGEYAYSASYILLPQQLGAQAIQLGIFTLDVSGVPLLVGIRTMRRLGAVLDLSKFVIVFTAVDMNRAIPLRRSPSGHALLDLRGDWLSGGCLVSDLGRDIHSCPPPEENFVESAYMLSDGDQGTGESLEQSSAEPVPEASLACQSERHEHGQHCGSDHDNSMRSIVTLTALVALHGLHCGESGNEMLPLDYDRQEGVDPRDPRAAGGLCKGNHTPKTRANQFAQWTVCTKCQVRLQYIPRMGCHAQHRQAGPLAPDTKEMIKNADPDAEYYPTNKEISLTAAENSALRQLERLRRLRQGDSKAAAAKETITTKTKEPQEPPSAATVAIDDSETEESPLSPGTIVVPTPVDKEQLPSHPSRKASRASETKTEHLEYQNRS
ncbi:unnamed protein product [Symbiodinium sp. CCMP2592]|nr:unnamed protein product [Symbiodinium sp. CCMP2592]